MLKRLLLLLAALACTDPSGSVPRLSVTMQIRDGDNQRNTVMHRLADPITVLVRDSASQAPRSGVVLNWYSGGTLVAVASTSDSGISRYAWTLGAGAGEQTMTARVLDPTTGDLRAVATAKAIADADVVRSIVAPDQIQATLGDTTLLPYALNDEWHNVSTRCADNGSVDRVVWQSADSSVVLPLGDIIVLSNGSRATRVVGKQLFATRINITGVVADACLPAPAVRQFVIGVLVRP